jgi:hypothetical protein
MKERQPFDVFEDQCRLLKKISDAERNYVNGRGMNFMVREALDDYIKKHDLIEVAQQIPDSKK